MKPIPKTENPLVLRTDFSNSAAWQQVRRLVQKPVGLFRFRANVDFLDDPQYADIDKARLLALLPPGYNHTFIIVADRAALSRPGFPLLVVDLYEGNGDEFRALPSQIQGIENNLSIANMDFAEFASAVDPDGVFRGFRRP